MEKKIKNHASDCAELSEFMGLSYGSRCHIRSLESQGVLGLCPLEIVVSCERCSHSTCQPQRQWCTGDLCVFSTGRRLEFSFIFCQASSPNFYAVLILKQCCSLWIEFFPCVIFVDPILIFIFFCRVLRSCKLSEGRAFLLAAVCFYIVHTRALSPAEAPTWASCENQRTETLTESYDCQCDSLLHNNSHEVELQLCALI